MTVDEQNQMREKYPTYPTATPESVWAALQESNRFLTEKFAETDRQMKESNDKLDRLFKESKAENNRLLKESSANFDRLLKESNDKFDRQMKKSKAEYDRRMEKLDKTMGAWSNNHGNFAEEYFFNSFEKRKRNFFGEKFDEIEKNVRGIKSGFKDEYDILLINGRSIGIVEVKYKAHENDLPSVLRKAETFRINFPEFEKHQVYLGMATLVFYPELEQECIRQGIAIIKQVGDTVVINDEHLKVF